MREYIFTFYKVILLLLMFFITSSCAVQMPLTGGDKDVKTPVLKKAIPESGTTHFIAEKIELSFDENIELNDAATNIIISPKPEKQPTFKANRKRLTLDFSGSELKPRTTYTIRFNNAVKDVNEGNLLPDLTYLFSTGDYLDSLSFSGVCKDALTDANAKDIIAALYPSASPDSLPYKHIPLYYSKTQDDGVFHISNLPSDSFKFLLFNDRNKDLLLTPGEEIALKNSLVKPQNKSAKPQENIFRLAKPAPVSKEWIKKINFVPPAIYVKHKGGLTPPLLTLANTICLYKIIAADSTVYFVNKRSDTSEIRLHFSSMEKNYDTLLSPIRKDKNLFKCKVSGAIPMKDFKDDSVKTILLFNTPSKNYDISKIEIINEKKHKAKLTTPIRIKNQGLYLYIYYESDEENLIININKGAFTNIYGFINDSLSFLPNLPSAKENGSLQINLSLKADSSAKNFTPAVKYILQLYEANSGVICNEFYVNKTEQLKIPFLKPGNYKMRLIEDANMNGVFDLPDYFNHTQPEKIWFYKEEISIKPNWEITANFSVTK